MTPGSSHSGAVDSNDLPPSAALSQPSDYTKPKGIANQPANQVPRPNKDSPGGFDGILKVNRTWPTVRCRRGKPRCKGAPLVRCQLLASEFYEALKDELRETPEADVTVRDTLLAASIQCLRAATATISTDRLLDELKSAIAVLQSDGLVSQPISRRPMLRVIEGGLSRI